MTDDNDRRVVLEQGAPDRLLPKDFWDVFAHRYFPILGLTYIVNVIGLAWNSGDFVHYMFEVGDVYYAALFVALWVSIPAVIWIVLRGSIMLTHMADIWYKVTAGVMSFTVFVSLILLPELNMLDMHLRTNFLATIPVFFVMYLFFVRGGMPPKAAHPLSVLGLTFMVYGLIVNFLY